MPQAIAAVLVVVGVPTAVATVLGTVIFFAATMAYSMAQAAKAKKAQKEAYNSAQVDRLANVVTTIAPRELVLGRVRKGGPIAFRGSAGALSDTLLIHIALAAHEIDAVEQVYLNDVAVTLLPDGRVTDAPYYQESTEQFSVAIGMFAGSTATLLDENGVAVDPALVITSSVKVIGGNGASGTEYAEAELAFTLLGNVVTLTDDHTAGGATPKVVYQYTKQYYFAKIWWDLGDGTAVADARTMELFPDEWTANHRGQGIAKLMAEFTYNETAFPSGVPQLTARIRGAKVYDPRDATTAWSENPALLARHVYQHSHFGKATVSSDEDDRFIAAANACDTSHGYVVDGVTDTRALYTAGTVGQFGAPAASLLDDLTQAMAGRWDFAGGELYLRAGVSTASVMDLDDSDLAVVQYQGDSENQEQLTISVHRERAEKFNTVNLRIWDEEQDYKQVALSPVKGSALITRDGEELAQEMALPAVSHPAQAQHIAGVMMRDARDPLTVEAPFKMTAYPLELFDTVRLTLARYGWVNKTLMVIGRTWHHDKGFIKLTLKETAASIFTPDASFLAQGRADNTRLPRPWEIEPPVLTDAGVYSDGDELTEMADGTVVSNMRVTWAALTDRRITEGGFIDVRWRRVGTDGNQWQTLSVDGNATEAIIPGVKDKRAYIIRARSRTSLALSDWSAQVVHIVIGKTEPPARVAAPFSATVSGRRILLEWPDNDELDLAGYEVRLADADWGTAGHVYRGQASRVFVSPPAAAGDVTTWYVKARDTGKRYSTLARSVSYTRQAPGTVGTVTKTVVRDKISMDWTDVSFPSLPAGGYEVRTNDAGWGNDNYKYRGPSSKSPWIRMPIGANTYYVRAYDLEGLYSAASASVSHTYAVPDTIPSLTLTRTGRDIEMFASTVGIDVPDNLKHYEFRIEKDGAGDVWSSATLTDTVKSQRRRAIWRAPSLGTFRVSVRMVDVDNNESAASASGAITISRPTAP